MNEKQCIGYVVFSGYDYYPCGGMNDYKGSFPTYEQAVEHLAFTTGSRDWVQVAAVYSDGSLAVVKGRKGRV